MVGNRRELTVSGVGELSKACVFTYRIRGLNPLKALQQELPGICLDASVYAVAFTGIGTAEIERKNRVFGRLVTRVRP